MAYITNYQYYTNNGIIPEDINKVMPILYKACNKYFYFTSTPHASADPAWDIEWGHINIKQNQ